jgi:hypothetical protein
MERDARSFPGTRQVFDTRNTTTFQTDRSTTRHARFFLASLTTRRRSQGQWSVPNLRPKS